MLKTRLIPSLIIKDGIIVQSIGFKRYLPIGKAEIAIEFFMNWDVDEIILLDITATLENRGPNLEFIRKASQKCFLPLTVGGGIRSVDDALAVLQAGADKVSLNAHAMESPALIESCARVFGSQAVVLSLDVKRDETGRMEVYTHSGKIPTGLDPVTAAKRGEASGAGELLVNSIDRDGMKTGYDLDLIRSVSEVTSIPVIACGGVGIMQHFVDGVLQGGAAAVSAANIFQHMEQSTIVAKAYMRKMGIDVRLISKARYDDFEFDELGRILKSPRIERTWWY